MCLTFTLNFNVEAESWHQVVQVELKLRKPVISPMHSFLGFHTVVTDADPYPKAVRPLATCNKL